MPVFTKGKDRVLFIHVPKTAGSSVTKLFLNNGYERTYYSESSRDPYRGLCGPQHMDAELLMGEFDLSDFDYIFSIYRDPIDRHLSEFTWAPWGLCGQDIYTEDLFDDWCPKIFQAYEQNPYKFDNHIRPQSEFYVDGVEVYNFDTIDTLTDKLCAKIGLDATELPYERSSRRDDRDYVIYDTTISGIKEFYKADYEWVENHTLL